MGCGSSSDGDDPRPLPSERSGLTADVPRTLRAACRRLASDAGGAVYCPQLVPSGRLSVTYAHADREGYALEIHSPTIHRASSGHWAVGAGEPGVVAALLHPSTSRMAPGVTKSSERLGGVAATRYVIPPDVRGSGIYRGHVLYAWRSRGKEYFLTVHGRRNGAPASLMAEALAAEIYAPGD